MPIMERRAARTGGIAMAGKNTAARIAANNRYNKRTYGRINLAVPKAEKEAIEAAAGRCGQSVNAYAVQAIRERMQRDEEKEKTDG